LDNLKVLHGYFGGRYGRPTRKGSQAIEAFESEDGIRLEHTYTGKAAAAFLDAARRTKDPLLFWNTYSSADISKWTGDGE
jgi:D-cysteine desulfhydrase